MPRGTIEILATLLATGHQVPIDGVTHFVNATTRFLIRLEAPAALLLNGHHRSIGLIEIFLLHRPSACRVAARGPLSFNRLARSRAAKPLVAWAMRSRSTAFGQLHLLGIDF